MSASPFTIDPDIRRASTAPGSLYGDPELHRLVENFLEGFHIPYVHAGLAGTLDYGEYTTELYPGASLQLGVAAPGEDCFDLPPGSRRAPGATSIASSARTSRSSRRSSAGSARGSTAAAATPPPASRASITSIACWRRRWRTEDGVTRAVPPAR